MTRNLFARGADGTRLFVRERTGPPDARVTSILCDGIACDGFIWKYLWDDLAKTTNVAHWHYRGHGRSSKPVDPRAIELEDLGRDLDSVRRELGDPDVVLFGHSMGCQVALEAYRIRPEKVRGVVLCCGSSGRITYTFKGSDILARQLPKLIERVDAHPDLARAIWGHVPPEVALQVALLTGEVDKTSIDPADLLPYMKHMVDIDLPMFLRMLRSAGEHSAEEMLSKVDVPALVIAGDRDTFTPPRYAEAMAAALPNAELLMVAGGTHVVPIERSALVAERVERFLKERVGV